MVNPVDNTAPKRLSDSLSRALGMVFAAGGHTASSRLPSPLVAAAFAERMKSLGVPAVAQGDAVHVHFDQLQDAIRTSGGSEAEFFANLARSVKTAQENEQPVATQSDQASQPPKLLERDKEKELTAKSEFAGLAEGLLENKAAVKFRESLMQRIELQERYEPGFDRAKAVSEANRLIKAVNKSHEAAMLGAKKRDHLAAARIEPRIEVHEQQIRMLAEAERTRFEEEMQKAKAERGVATFMRGTGDALGQPSGAPFGMPPALGANDIKLPQPLAFEPRELSGAMMQNAISQMMETLNLREPAQHPAGPAAGAPVVAMVPFIGQSAQMERA